MPVHVFGIPGDILGLKELADELGLPIIEDLLKLLEAKYLKIK